MEVRVISSVCRRFLDTVYPPLCEVCGRRLTQKETTVCLGCELDLPLTDYHLEPFNPIHERLATKPPIDRAGAMFFYLRDDPYSKLIQNAKYDGRPQILRHLARHYGESLRKAGFFDGIDMIQPVPMHWFKQWRRGYNQTEWLAQGLMDVTGLPVSDCLEVVRPHGTQTRRNRIERWFNAQRTYAAKKNCDISGKHILIVDDVITTGSTIKACAEALYSCGTNIRISILSLAVTRQH